MCSPCFWGIGSGRQHRAQEGANGAHASPIRGDVHVDVAGAGTHRSVHVIQNGHAHFAGCVDEGWRYGMRIFWAADVDGAAGSFDVSPK